MSPVYLFHGDDEYRLELKYKNFLNTRKPAEISPNDDLESKIFGMSLFSSEKIFLIDIKSFESDDLNRLFVFFNSCLSQDILPKDTCVIFYCRGKLDKRQKLSRLLIEKAEEVFDSEQFKPWKQNEISEWLSKRAEDKDTDIEKSAIEKLVEFYGNDSARLDTELTRLSAYANFQKISLKHVQESCESSAEGVFQLLEAIIRRHSEDISELVNKICRFQDPQPLIASLQTNIRNYLAIKSLELEKNSQIKIAEILGMHPYRVKQDLEKTKNISLEELFRIFKIINLVEERIKTGYSFDPVLTMRFELMGIYTRQVLIQMGDNTARQ